MSTQSYWEFMTQNPIFYQMVRESMAKAWAKSQAEGRIEDGIEHAHGQILKLLQCRFSGNLLGLAKQRLGDIQDVEVLNTLLEAVLVGDDPQRVRALLEEHSPTGHGTIGSILTAVLSQHLDMQNKLIEHLGHIQDVKILEQIEEAALTPDLQRVWALARANDPKK